MLPVVNWAHFFSLFHRHSIQRMLLISQCALQSAYLAFFHTPMCMFSSLTFTRHGVRCGFERPSAGFTVLSDIFFLFLISLCTTGHQLDTHLFSLSLSFNTTYTSFFFFFPVTVCTTRNLPHILPNTNVHFFSLPFTRHGVRCGYEPGSHLFFFFLLYGL